MKKLTSLLAGFFVLFLMIPALPVSAAQGDNLWISDTKWGQLIDNSGNPIYAKGDEITIPVTLTSAQGTILVTTQGTGENADELSIPRLNATTLTYENVVYVDQVLAPTGSDIQNYTFGIDSQKVAKGETLYVKVGGTGITAGDNQKATTAYLGENMPGVITDYSAANVDGDLVITTPATVWTNPKVSITIEENGLVKEVTEAISVTNTSISIPNSALQEVFSLSSITITSIKIIDSVIEDITLTNLNLSFSLLRYGDIDGNGEINVSDIIMASEIAVGYSGYAQDQKERANVNSKIDMTIDISDVVLILERVVGQNEKFPVEQYLRSSILDTKNGADAIVSMTYDDSYLASAEFNYQMFAQYNLKGTAMLITNSINQNNLARWENVAAGGRVDFGSHSTSHVILEESTLADSTYVSEIDNSKTTLKTLFPSQDVITFAPSNNTMTPEGLVHVKDFFYAQRKGSRGYNSLNPSDDDWYNIKIQGIGDVSTVDRRNAWVDDAIASKAWLVEMWHGIEEGGYQTQTKADAESHYAYISQMQNEGKIWCASFTEATKYIRERQVSTVNAEIYADAVRVYLTYPADALPADVFDYPLTVKVQIPDNWESVNANQGGIQSTAVAFSDNGVNSTYVSVIPNAGPVILTNGGIPQ